MRVRDHVALSAAGGVMLVPLLHESIVIPWVASIFIDVDHYLYFSIRFRSLSPRKAMRFFGRAQPPRHAGTHLLHQPAVLLLLLLLSIPWPILRLVLLGMAFHVALDVCHELRISRARRAGLRRDNNRCQHCGIQGRDVVAHLQSQPPLLPSYRAEHFVSLCPACHELAHGDHVALAPEVPSSPLRACPADKKGAPPGRRAGERGEAVNGM